MGQPHPANVRKGTRVMEQESSRLDYIRIQWEDIHHCRQQTWQALVIVAGVFAGVGQLGGAQPVLTTCLAVAGAVIAALSAYMTWQHREIMTQKLGVIGGLERQLGIEFPTRRKTIPVQMLIFLIFGVATAAFAAIPFVIRPHQWPLGVAIADLVLIVFVLRAFTPPTRSPDRGVPTIDSPRYAESEDLRRCLALLERDPLKLIAPMMVEREGIEEREWEGIQWSLEEGRSGSAMLKDILTSPIDTYQLSVADSSSRQDRHYHDTVLEIYISELPMELRYKMDADSDTWANEVVRQGVLVVPPRLPHEVELGGLTYVVQVSVTGDRIGEDKTLVVG